MNPTPMSPDEVIRCLRSMRYNKPPTITEVAQVAGLSRAHVHHLIIGRYSLTRSAQDRLSKALRLVWSRWSPIQPGP